VAALPGRNETQHPYAASETAVRRSPRAGPATFHGPRAAELHKSDILQAKGPPRMLDTSVTQITQGSPVSRRAVSRSPMGR
jgi:hypothetical protein